MQERPPERARAAACLPPSGDDQHVRRQPVGGVVYNRQTRRRRNSDVYSPPRLNVPQAIYSKTFMPCKATALRGFSYAHRGVVLKREGVVSVAWVDGVKRLCGAMVGHERRGCGTVVKGV